MLVRILLAIIAAAAITFAIAPDIAKPLMVKYYRSLYRVQTVRPS